MTFGWRARATPLAPLGALARGPAAHRLADRLALLADEPLGRLVGAAGEGLLVVMGEVPWVDGLTWLGRDPLAAALLLPTLEGPDLPLDLVQAALLRRVPEGSAPIGVFPGGGIAGGVARPVDRAWLARWRAT